MVFTFLPKEEVQQGMVVIPATPEVEGENRRKRKTLLHTLVNNYQKRGRLSFTQDEEMRSGDIYLGKAWLFRPKLQLATLQISS